MKTKTKILFAGMLLLLLVLTTCKNPFYPFEKDAGVDKGTGVGMSMVWISAGTFTMGSSDTLNDGYEASPPHSVTLTRGFYMGKYEVTQEQYKTVMGTNPGYFTTSPEGNPNKLPVEQVSWYDALVFCNKLSIMENLTPVYTISGTTNPAGWGTVPSSSDGTWNAVTADFSKNGYRLPTEAEWEYACRAGIDPYDPYNPVWDGITAANAPGWYYGNSDNKTHEAGKKPTNAFGLHDMHGNVSEWCWDWFDNYPPGAEAQSDPPGPASSPLDCRVWRGGCWLSSAQILRSALRGCDGPWFWDYGFGFRVVRC